MPNLGTTYLELPIKFVYLVFVCLYQQQPRLNEALISVGLECTHFMRLSMRGALTHNFITKSHQLAIIIGSDIMPWPTDTAALYAIHY